MKTKPSLVRADGGIILYPVAPVHTGLSAVVHPGYPKFDYSFRLHETLQQTGSLPLGMLIHHQLQGLEHFPDSLEEFRLMGVSAFHFCVDPIQILAFEHDTTSSEIFINFPQDFTDVLRPRRNREYGVPPGFGLLKLFQIL